MNNLTTRKIVLGMLMTLVLAFSVQGIADALTVTRRSSDDLEYRFAGQTFNISFSVSDVDADTDNLDIPVHNSFKLTRIRGIDVSQITLGGTLRLVGNWAELNSDRDGDNDLITDNDVESYRQLRNNTTYNLTYMVNDNAGAGAINIDIDSVEYTIYVVDLAGSAVAPSFRDEPIFRGFKGTLGLANDDEFQFVGTNTGVNDPVMATLPTIPVTYEVQGNGRVYVKKDDRETSRIRQLHNIKQRGRVA